MSEVKKLNEEALEQVTGGIKKRVMNKSDNAAVIKAGPGQDFEGLYKVRNGDYVDLTGNKHVAAGTLWLEVEGGGWINASRLEQ